MPSPAHQTRQKPEVAPLLHHQPVLLTTFAARHLAAVHFVLPIYIAVFAPRTNLGASVPRIPVFIDVCTLCHNQALLFIPSMSIHGHRGKSSVCVGNLSYKSSSTSPTFPNHSCNLFMALALISGVTLLHTAWRAQRRAARSSEYPITGVKSGIKSIGRMK